ncbi:metallophosphoesterase [Papillibacter cinnamivorans]|uniref:Calcineurin-like phosphoesterase domain-containing protein n=1 Tax=Papillibacter cinnamivorans DSM 12816 TaxID=1122930 RepID=A0A1W2CZS3_9FIRM|nr:metallophosphoesterase [Papillibacter cinnamivorans]SMC90701.1 hypothetical protein SAMN02745168_0294 [Papillibacter cinnamivorans DSM 12816]
MRRIIATYWDLFRAVSRKRSFRYFLLPPVYALAGVYAALRLWRAFGAWLPFGPYAFVCILLFSLGPAALLSMALPGYSPLKRGIVMAGSLWTASLLYGFAAACLLELVRLLDKALGNPLSLRLEAMTGLSAVTLSALLVFSFLLFFFAKGIYNAFVPRIHRYSVQVPNLAQTMKLVLLSDAHLLNPTSPVRLDKLCSRVGGIRPDAVLLAGDIVDNRPELAKQQKVAEKLSAIESRHGIFYAPGNHEYIHAAKGSREKTGSVSAPSFQDRLASLLTYFQGAGIHVLSDEKTTLGGLCTLVGRRDSDVEKHTGIPRKPLSYVLDGADLSLPVVVLDHQTEYFREAREAGVDLLLSGHTHQGQVFPLTVFSRRRYAHNYGAYREDAFTHIVSSGCGSWGPPVRFGSRAEIVLISLYS